ncbi:hypothetical protein HQO24_04815 [Rhodococcus fascians]|nr:hypothetical protein [Rhodococcus fascians]MBY4395628.1 hypothetical protein [Rhodococcus fascians]MBY4404930.1 hypothetical protein [Rhodococcus fascians]MBY4420386.1 hypothetical protein [Rhodococcus fascians]MBY4459399.1 hypothetical protein [Rhodococcus fascians]
MQIFFQNSAFNVRVRFSDRHELGKDTNQDNSWLNPIWLEVESVVRSVLDSLGFVLAASLEMEMTTGRGDVSGIIGVHNSLPAYARVEGDWVESDLLGRYLKAAEGNANIRHALADMRMALRLSTDTAFYCYRAIECIRQEFVELADGTKTAPSWTRIHAALGTNQAEMEPLTKLATARRHGESLPISHEDRLKWLAWTRDIVGRYVEEYRWSEH